MTIFETQAYTKEDGNIVGAQVTAEYDGNIESVSIVDETALNALAAQLDVLDETYVQFEDESSLAGSTIDELLENTEEDVPINATTLSGFASDAFSKTGHTHTKADITNLLKYVLTASDINPQPGDSVTITVKCLNMADQPVANSPITLKKNGVAAASGYTNSNGAFTYTFAANTSDRVYNFSVNNDSAILTVKTVHYLDWIDETCSLGKLLVNHDLNLAQWNHSGTVSISNANVNKLVEIGSFSSSLAPKNGIRLKVANNENLYIVITSEGKINALCDNAGNGKSYTGLVMWHFY